MTDISLKPCWDIFCKVVDNFGDIGVCWRLAKQLTHEHGLQVRLYVDDLQVASKIIPIININKILQIIDSIEIVNFNLAQNPAQVVIEAFACGLPEAYQNQMDARTIWVNLEYLSAEPWVADFHKGQSKVGRLTRHFFFPGFNVNTGGLSRERDVIARRDANANAQNEAFNISLFCYENAPLQAMFHALACGNHKTSIYAPLSNAIQKIAPFFSKSSLNIDDVLTNNQLTLHVLPFLSQDDYDALLWRCDLNFVRGEDSWVRAIWAGKPFIWQPYVQKEQAHMVKLDAFLNVFYQNFEHKKIVTEMHHAWTAGQLSDEFLHSYLASLNAIHVATALQSSQLAVQADLATNLIAFCNALNA